MSFLPFVLSFLLILVLGSSFLFHSFRSTTIEKTVVQGINRAHLDLISKQSIKAFKALPLLKNEKDGSQPPKLETKQNTAPEKPYVQKRDLRRNLSLAKFNLWPLMQDPESLPAKILYKKAIRLIEILYGSTDFFKGSPDPQLAMTLLDAIMESKEQDLVKVSFKDQQLDQLYYKMLRGTNTAYPRFQEYFKIEECKSKAPISFTFASTPVLEAVLGEGLTKRVLAQEKEKWGKNPKDKKLTQDELRQLIQTYQLEGFDTSTNLESIFSFEKQGSGLPQALVDENSKVMFMN